MNWCFAGATWGGAGTVITLMRPFAGTTELPVAQIKINFCNYNAAQTKQKYKANYQLPKLTSRAPERAIERERKGYREKKRV